MTILMEPFNMNISFIPTSLLSRFATLGILLILCSCGGTDNKSQYFASSSYDNEEEAAVAEEVQTPEREITSTSDGQ